MALSLPFSMVDILTELGLTAPKNAATDLKNATVNDCSPTTPDQTLPFNLTTWDGYDHSAGPAKPASISGNPGSVSGGTGDSTQESHVFTKIDAALTCASVYDVARAETSGGAKTIIGPDQAGLTLVYNHGTPDSIAGYFYWRGVGNTGNHGTWSDELVLRTAPQAPQSVGSSDDLDCADLVITVTWGIGTAPGLRDSVVKWDVQLNGGGYGALQSTASGAVQFTYNPGAVNDGDQFDFRLYFDEEGTGTRVTKSHTVTCPL